MSYSLPEPDSFQPPAPEFRWTKLDLLVVVSFFALTWLASVIISGILFPNLSAIALVLLQVVLDVVWVSFIFFLIRVVHGLPILETIKWTHSYRYRNRFLVLVGISLAIAVALVGSWFPPSSPTPLEKLITSSGALYLFLLFGVVVAPAVEEILFRGFLFRVLEDIAGKTTAVAVTALVFALLHAPQLWGSWAAILLILVVGCILSIVRQYSGSLIPSFIIHTSYNGTLFAGALAALAQQTLKR